MTTRFMDTSECAKVIAGAADVPLATVEEAIKGAETISIGFPQFTTALRFEVGGYLLAIEDFRDGKAIWSIDPETQFMVRW